MLYHVSFCKVKNGFFTPRIPKHRADGEDNTIARICFAPTIEQALTAMPHGGEAVVNMFKYKHIAVPILHLYMVDEDEIPAENILTGDAVQKYVPDAATTGKTWVINQSVKCWHEIIRIEHIKSQEFKDTNGDITTQINYIAWKTLKRLPKNAPEKIIHQSEFIRKFYANIDCFVKG